MSDMFSGEAEVASPLSAAMPSLVVGYDTTHANIGRLPAGAQVAGYSTGTPDIQWTAEDWAAHPGALRIDQDGGSDPTGDYLDVESGAATNDDGPSWYRRALADYHAGTRPGQRWPGFYTSANNVTPLVNTLIAGGVSSGPRLIIANWNLSELQAAAEVMAASGPFPVVGVQFRDPGPYDIDVWDGAWLRAVSVKPVPPPQGPFRHVANGTESFSDIARARGTSADHLFAVALAAYTPRDWEILSSVLGHVSRLDFESVVVSLAKRKLPAGTPYYTSNP